MNEAFIIALGGILVQAGVMLATVKFLSEKQDAQHGQTSRDLNGLGRKERAIMAEVIIQAQDQPKQDFAILVRKLINGI